MKRLITCIVSMGLTAGICFSSFAGSWKLDSRGWWYQNDNGTWPSNGWQNIQGTYYYFDSNGYMLSDTITPDGYYVDQSGAWVKNAASRQEKNEMSGMGKYYLYSETGEEVILFERNSGSYIILSDNHDGTISMEIAELHQKGGTPFEPEFWTLRWSEYGFWDPIKLNGEEFKGEGFALKFDGQTATIDYAMGTTLFVR